MFTKGNQHLWQFHTVCQEYPHIVICQKCIALLLHKSLCTTLHVILWFNLSETILSFHLSLRPLAAVRKSHLISKSNSLLINSLALTEGKHWAITTRAPAVYTLLQANRDVSHSQGSTYWMQRLMQTNALSCHIHSASTSLFIISQEGKEQVTT